MLTANGIHVGIFRHGSYLGRILPWTSERTVILARCKTRVVRRRFEIERNTPAFHTSGCGLVSGRRDAGKWLVVDFYPNGDVIDVMVPA